MAAKKAATPKPTVGRIVHLHTETGELAAIVTKVNEDGTVNLVIFADSEHNPRGYPTFLLQGIGYGKGIGQWSWPPREGD